MTVRRISPLLRRGTAAEWAEADPVLHLGEFGIETDEDGSFVAEKCGDGITSWTGLPATSRIPQSLNSFSEASYTYLSFEESAALDLTLPDDVVSWPTYFETDGGFPTVLWFAPAQGKEFQLRHLHGASNGQMVLVANFFETGFIDAGVVPTGLVTIPFLSRTYDYPDDGPHILANVGGFDHTDILHKLETRTLLWNSYTYPDPDHPPKSLVLRAGECAMFRYVDVGVYHTWFHVFDTAIRSSTPTELSATPTVQDIADALVAQGIVTQAT